MTIVPVMRISQLGRKESLCPIYFEPTHIADDEEFKFIDDTVLENIMPQRYLVSNYGRFYDIHMQKFMNPVPNADMNQNPYFKLKFAYYEDINTLKAKDIYCHRAVLGTYNPNKSSRVLEGDHINGHHEDNRIVNLNWEAPVENKNLAIERGFILKGENKSNASLSNRQAVKIYNKLANGESPSVLAKKYNVSNNVIHNIKSGKNYKSITEKIGVEQVFNSSNSSLEDNIVHEICRRLEIGDKIIDIANDLKIGRYIINDIKAKRNYINISSQYNIPEVKKNITDDIVHAICRRLENGDDVSGIARQLNIPETIITSIKRSSSHTDISKNYKFPKIRSGYISDKVAKRICELLEIGFTCGKIAKLTGTSKSIVEGIFYKRSFKELSKKYSF